MTPDMKRLCEAAIAMLPSRRLDEDEAYAIVRAVLMALREIADSGYLTDEVTSLDRIGDPERAYPGTEGFDHQVRNLIDHILGGSAVIRDEDGDVLVSSGVSAEVQGATAFISGPAPDASYIVGKPNRPR